MIISQGNHFIIKKKKENVVGFHMINFHIKNNKQIAFLKDHQFGMLMINTLLFIENILQERWLLIKLLQKK